jgi:hypothetical protein
MRVFMGLFDSQTPQRKKTPESRKGKNEKAP